MADSSPSLNPHTSALGAGAAAVAAELKAWQTTGKVDRLWKSDPTLWANADEAKWTGWLNIVESELAGLEVLERGADDAREAAFKYVVVLGMGGSSLCPDVLRQTFGPQRGCPELVVIDSVVPAQLRTALRKLDLRHSLFIVASKSGGTIEPNTLKQFFWEETAKVVGHCQVANHFVAVTDPGTKMEGIARDERFRATYYGSPSIGGRYSALSKFGLVPGALMGLNLRRFLTSTKSMVEACKKSDANPGLELGVAMGVLGKQGRDKITVIASPGINSLGAWCEQLIAESLGKKGIGIVPIDDELVGPPEVYGNDRLFVYERLETAPSAVQDAAVAALEHAGHPVVTVRVQSPYDLGQEFFRWEIATAVVGSILGINPFDQPDVEAAKIAAKKLTSEYEASGKLAEETPIHTESGVTLFADAKYAAELKKNGSTLRDILAAHLGKIGAGDYFAINAYVEMNDGNGKHLHTLRHSVRAAKKVATTLGYGPRFLHSTGQLHKGGPNTGVFLQITSCDARDLPIPGQKFSFGLLKTCQAAGDFAVLVERGRRALRVHLGPDVEQGLAWLSQVVAGVL
jgi:transaldolase / glucose-6-phosphate isomerase